MNKATFVGGPLDGQTRAIAEHVKIVVYPHPIVNSSWVWDWTLGGFLWYGKGEPTDVPASYENITYRKQGNTFVVDSPAHWACAKCWSFEDFLAGEPVKAYCGAIFYKGSPTRGSDCEECLRIEKAHKHEF